MSESISQIFALSFVFLLGVIAGALGEMYFGKRRSEKSVEQTPEPMPPIAQPPIREVKNEMPAHGVVVEQSMPVVKNDIGEKEVEPALPPPDDLPRYVPAPIAATAPSITPPAGKNEVQKPQKQLSIAEQVDEILQELQRFSTSSLPSVSLMDDGHQGVQVKVGSKYYAGIDAVAEPEAKELIRRAVQEWERRSSK